MAIKYVFVRIPEPTFKIFKGVQTDLNTKVKTLTGKSINIPMTKVFKLVATPTLNPKIRELLK
jgi:hypothetical protein